MKKVFSSKNFQILKKIESSKKITKLQIALKYSLFKLWTNQKSAQTFFNKVYINKKFWARGARQTSSCCEDSKSSNFGLGGRIFYRRARGSARAPIFLGFKKFIKFYTFYILHSIKIHYFRATFIRAFRYTKPQPRGKKKAPPLKDWGIYAVFSLVLQARYNPLIFPFPLLV